MHLSVSCFIRASMVAQMVKNRPAVQETWVRSVGGEDPLEERIATHSNVLPYYFPLGTNPMDRGAWQDINHGLAKSQAQLSN